MLSSGRPVRALLLLLLAAVAACFGTADLAGEPNHDPASPGAVQSFCATDEDCVPAAPTCCECPTFAVTSDDPVARACSNVMCPGSACSENVVARCNDDARCELACKPLECEQTAAQCAYGYAIGMNGCLTCECAVPAPNGCTADADCVQTRDDCCGCARGGRDTAVLPADLAAHEATLMCAADPACPGINTCTTDEPTCVQGRCALVSPELPPGACGRADLPLCADGRCLVNVSDQANMHGVGVCARM